MPLSDPKSCRAKPLERIQDFSLHGLLTVQLVNAPQWAMEELVQLLGPSSGTPGTEPDITVVFAGELGSREELRYIGLLESAYQGDRFYQLDRSSRRITFDFERFGEPCEFICEGSANVFPYLLPIIGLRLLRKGYLMLHSSAFVYDGAGIVVTGWQKGGKTEMLLSFMAAGAEYLSDEWTILSPSEGKMWGISGTLQIWDWHLRYLPEYWGRVRPSDQRRLRLLRMYQRAYRLIPGAWKGHGPIGQLLDRLSMDGGISLLGQTRSSPKRLFGDRLWRGPAPIDLIFLAGVGSKIRVSQCDSEEVARRMVASLAFERRELLARYEQFRFAFPGRSNRFLESAGELDLQLLSDALDGRPAYEVLHPYPVPLRALHRACDPLLTNSLARKAVKPQVMETGIQR